MTKQRKEQKYQGPFLRYPDNDTGDWWGRYKELQYGSKLPPRCKLINNQDLVRETVIVKGKPRTKTVSETKQQSILEQLRLENEPRMIAKHQHKAINHDGTKNSERYTFPVLTREYIEEALPEKS